MSIKQKIKWTATSQFLKVASQLLSLLYLTQIIPPSEYGILAMAIIAINLANIFSDMGLSSALIQKSDTDDGYLNLNYTLNLAIGSLLMLCLALASSPISLYFEEPKLVDILLILSTTYPIISIYRVHSAYMEKHGEFKTLAIIESTSSILAFILALTLANLSFGAFSIVAQIWFSYAISAFLIMWRSKIQPSITLNINKSDFNEIFNFGSNIFLFHMVNYVSFNLDKFLVARHYSPHVLGVYSLAYRITMMPVTNISGVISRVLLPHFASQSVIVDKKRADFMSSLFLVLTLVAPAMIGLSLIAKDLIPLFFNDNWAVLPDILTWLAPIGITQSVISITGPVIISAGQTKRLFHIGVFGAAACLSAAIVGVNYGLETFCALYLLGNIIYMFPPLICASRILAIKKLEIFTFFLRALLPSLVMALSILVAKFSIVSESGPQIAAMIYIFIGAAVYLATFLICNINLVRTLLISTKNRKFGISSKQL